MDEIRFLLILPAPLNKFILATNLIRAISQQVHKSKVYCLALDSYLPLLKLNPYIEDVFSYTIKNKSISNKLTETVYDYIIDFQKSSLSMAIKKKTKTLSFDLKNPEFKKWFYIKFKRGNRKTTNFLKANRFIDAAYDMLRVFDLKPDGLGSEVYDKKGGNEYLKYLPNQFRDGYIVFAIDAESKTNKIPNRELITLLKSINKPIVLVGSDKVTEEAKLIHYVCKDKIFDSTGQIDFDFVIPLLKNAELVMGYNNDLLHLSAALNKKIISIWGSNIPEVDDGPIARNHHEIVQVLNLKCRPCAIYGRKSCPKKHFNCIKELPLSNINYKIYSLINKTDLH